ncbi:MAG: hypothetical protein U9Q62_07525 [Campylobacterota bacterium]|nr:hypothetical protein [Campylobacterota bacterium]
MLKTVLLLLLFILFTPLQAQEIDQLLGAYEKASELSHKTKDEAAGNLIVYTRDDLERMQVQTLKDIVKSLRFFQYAENRFGQPDILNQDPLSNYSKSIRTYLNDHELFNPLAGSGFFVFGDMELDFIDHIEIYEGFPSFDFGTEPATVVIRLYSKTAEHDTGGKIKALYGSYGSNTLSGYYADQLEDFNYFTYASRRDNQREEFTHDGRDAKRNKRTERVYASLATDNHQIELHGSHQKGDGFIGGIVGATAEESELKNRYFSASLHSTFQDKSLTFNLIFLQNISDFDIGWQATDPALIVNSDPATSPSLPLIPITQHKQELREDSYTAGLKKKWSLDKHTLTGGIKFRHKHFDLTDLTLTSPAIGALPPISQAYYSEDVYSAFLQDNYSIDENQMLTLSLMYQHYHRKHSSVDDQDTFQRRLGYIYANDNWVAKTFLSHQEFASEPYMTISPHYGNEDLNKESYQSIFQEVSYQTDISLTKLVLGYGKNRDIPILDPATFTMQNSDKSIYGHSAAIEQTFFFREKDKLELQAWSYFLESPYEGNHDLRHHTGVIRMLNTFGRFDLFNELLIQEGYHDQSNGHDYSAGIIYHASDDLQFNVKGENIFDDGLMWDYYIAPGNSINVPVIERRFWAGMEYLF